MKLEKLDLLALILVVFYILIFVYAAYATLDPDFGWHIRLGEIISQNGIPRTDPLSYTMPSYPYIDHSWLTDVVMFSLLGRVEYGGFAVIFSLLAVGALVLFSDIFLTWRKYSVIERKFFLALFSLASASILFQFGIRVQVISLLFTALTFFLVRGPNFGKYWYLIVLIGVLWVNIHGSFILLIGFLLYKTLKETIESKKIYFQGVVFTTLATISMSVANPYGIRIWSIPIQQITKTSFRSSINEWQPSIFFGNFPYWFLVVISIVLIYNLYRKLSISELLLYVFFLLQSFIAVRHTSVWVMVSLPLIVKLMSGEINDLIKIKGGKKRLEIAGRYFLMISMAVSAYSVYTSLSARKGLSEINFYPVKAVEFIKDEQLSGRLYSSYNWGGYLNWKLPEKKVFIDGRMDVWSWEGAKEGESNNIMEEYMNSFEDKSAYFGLLDKYEVENVLIGKQKASFSGALFQKISDYFHKMFKGENAVRISIPEELEVSEEWELIYEDETAYLFRRMT